MLILAALSTHSKELPFEWTLWEGVRSGRCLVQILLLLLVSSWALAQINKITAPRAYMLVFMLCYCQHSSGNLKRNSQNVTH